jgi:hypothetical protein
MVHARRRCATSLATIIPTAISSSRAHQQRGGIDWELVRAWSPGMIAGGLVGSLLAANASDGVLTGVFGVIAALAALKMVLPLDELRLAQRVPRGLGGNLLAASIGGISSMMGIGGGTLSVPAMTLTGGAMHTAVGTAAFFGLLLAVPGTLGYLLASPRSRTAGAYGWPGQFRGAAAGRADVHVDRPARRACRACARAADAVADLRRLPLRGGGTNADQDLPMTTNAITGPWFEDFHLGLEFDAPAVTLTAGHAALHQALFGDRMRLPLDHATSARVTGSSSRRRSVIHCWP